MQAQIDSREQEKRSCLSELTAADTAIEDLAGQVQAKEERRRQLDRDYAQSDTYQERERLENQKQSLLTEQSRLVQEMERDALEIKREALRLTHLCETALAWDAEDVLRSGAAGGRAGWDALHRQLQDIDPVAAARIHPNDPQRLSRALEVFFISGKTLTELTQTSGDALPYQVHQFAIAPASRELLHQRIEQRFHQM